MSLGDVQAVLPAAPPHAPASRLQQGADELVRTAYERCGHSVSQTARTLGISRSTVYRHLRGGGREWLTLPAWVGATLRARFAVPSLPLSAPPTPRTQRR
jgi:DNA-binding XRE family transcriptional regulator